MAPSAIPTNESVVDTASMAGTATRSETKYDAIPGPLGLDSASLRGKVALVTGAGECCLGHYFVFLSRQSGMACLLFSYKH